MRQFLRSRVSRRTVVGFSLIEVAMALGIVSFCILALMGLFPIMLNSMRESREKNATYRIYQLVAEDLRSRNPDGSQPQAYRFDSEGLAVESEAAVHYTATATRFDAAVPDQTPSADSHLSLWRIRVVNVMRGSTNLQRPLWTVPPPSAQP